MTDGDLNDWNLNPDPETLAYHLRQWDEPYRSTVAFAEFARPWLEKSDVVVDLGCGAGGPTRYIASQFRNLSLSGIDASYKLILAAREQNAKSGFLVHRFIPLDLDQISVLDPPIPDGVISLQTFSWMPDIETPLDQICRKIAPKWMAFSSLFYEGDISCKIEVGEPKRPRKSYSNIYSIPRTEAFLKERGYKRVGIEPFYIDIDLPVPSDMDLMKTYTMQAPFRKLQFSGPLLLPWYFLAFERTES